MDFISFLILLLISVIVSAILHYVLGFYAVAGTRGFLAKVVIGWIGAWLGTPVYGSWFPGVQYGQIFYVPAILGCLATIFIVVMFVKVCCSSSSSP